MGNEKQKKSDRKRERRWEENEPFHYIEPVARRSGRVARFESRGRGEKRKQERGGLGKVREHAYLQVERVTLR